MEQQTLSKHETVACGSELFAKKLTPINHTWIDPLSFIIGFHSKLLKHELGHARNQTLLTGHPDKHALCLPVILSMKFHE